MGRKLPEPSCWLPRPQPVRTAAQDEDSPSLGQMLGCVQWPRHGRQTYQLGVALWGRARDSWYSLVPPHMDLPGPCTPLQLPLLPLNFTPEASPAFHTVDSQ